MEVVSIIKERIELKNAHIFTNIARQLKKQLPVSLKLLFYNIFRKLISNFSKIC